MSLPVYLAMTASEMSWVEAPPQKVGWMACHFSAYGTGLSNVPQWLPKGSLLILNDRTPVRGHDPALICRQLSQAVQELECDGILLDFQRPDNPQTAAIVKAIAASLPCPVGVTEYYAKDADCPVFLTAPLHQPMERCIVPWQGRALWLELALTSQVITVTESGSRFGPILPAESGQMAHEDDRLCCRYYTKVSANQVDFTLLRTADCLPSLLKKAEALGFSRAIGLYQELGSVI